MQHAAPNNILTEKGKCHMRFMPRHPVQQITDLAIGTGGPQYVEQWLPVWATSPSYIITSPGNVMMNLNCTGNPDDQEYPCSIDVMSSCLDGSGADSQDEKTAIHRRHRDDQTFLLPSSGWA